MVRTRAGDDVGVFGGRVEVMSMYFVDMDDAGKGMNVAFGIGRLCDLDDGRKRLLHHKDANKMVRIEAWGWCGMGGYECCDRWIWLR